MTNSAVRTAGGLDVYYWKWLENHAQRTESAVEVIQYIRALEARVAELEAELNDVITDREAALNAAGNLEYRLQQVLSERDALKAAVEHNAQIGQEGWKHAHALEARVAEAIRFLEDQRPDIGTRAYTLLERLKKEAPR